MAKGVYDYLPLNRFETSLEWCSVSLVVHINA